jgi:hypothetical protein
MKLPAALVLSKIDSSWPTIAYAAVRPSTRIVVGSNKDGDWDLYTVGTGGNDALKSLLKKPFAQFALAVAPDGSVVYEEDNPVTGADLWMLSPDGRTTPLAVTAFKEAIASISPDGQIVAYVSDDSGARKCTRFPRPDTVRACRFRSRAAPAPCGRAMARSSSTGPAMTSWPWRCARLEVSCWARVARCWIYQVTTRARFASSTSQPTANDFC